MTTEWFKNKITEQIKCGREILFEFESLQVVTQEKRPFFNNYDEGKQSILKSELYKWEHRVMDILKRHWGGSRQDLIDEFKISDPTRWGDFKDFGIDAVKNNITVLESYMDRIGVFEEDDNNTNVSTDTIIDKPYKVFISHSHKDKEFAGGLVELLKFIGIKEDKVFCTSVRKCGVPIGENIFDRLRRQFNEYRLFMIFIHSPAYYESPVSLNEMGATWVLREEACSFLVKDFDFDRMTGVINKNDVAIKVNAQDAAERLDEFKDKLVRLFELKEVDSTEWDSKRDEFLQRVNSLPKLEMSDNRPKTLQKEFEVSYLPVLSKFFELLDAKDYPQWMYEWVCSGESWIRVEKYENIRKSYETLCRIGRKEGFEEINDSLKVLTQLLKGYLFVCDLYGRERKDGTYVIDKFYKATPNNPRYDYQLREYMECCFLIYDLSFELTRMLNLLLDDIHKYVPDFLNEYGIMTIKGENPEDVKYRNNEAALHPYSGLRQFVESTRFTRGKFIGKQENIEYLRSILDAYKD